LPRIDGRRAFLLIDVEPEPRIVTQVVPDAEAVYRDVIDAFGRRRHGSRAVAIVEALCPNPSDDIERPKKLLGD
jgi:hypothetical protein